MADRKSLMFSKAVAAYFNPRFNGAPAEDRVEAVVDSVALSLGQISHPSPAHAGAGYADTKRLDAAGESKA